jgi:hypothetical protein
MEQIIARLLLEIKAMQEKPDANVKKMMARLETKMEANQERWTTGKRDESRVGIPRPWIDAHHEEMKAMLNASLEKWRQVQERCSSWCSIERSQ